MNRWSERFSLGRVVDFDLEIGVKWGSRREACKLAWELVEAGWEVRLDQSACCPIYLFGP